MAGLGWATGPGPMSQVASEQAPPRWTLSPRTGGQRWRLARGESDAVSFGSASWLEAARASGEFSAATREARVAREARREPRRPGPVDRAAGLQAALDPVGLPEFSGSSAAAARPVSIGSARLPAGRSVRALRLQVVQSSAVLQGLLPGASMSPSSATGTHARRTVAVQPTGSGLSRARAARSAADTGPRTPPRAAARRGARALARAFPCTRSRGMRGGVPGRAFPDLHGRPEHGAAPHAKDAQKIPVGSPPRPRTTAKNQRAPVDKSNTTPAVRPSPVDASPAQLERAQPHVARSPSSEPESVDAPSTLRGFLLPRARLEPCRGLKTQLARRILVLVACVRLLRCAACAVCVRWAVGGGRCAAACSGESLPSLVSRSAACCTSTRTRTRTRTASVPDNVFEFPRRVLCRVLCRVSVASASRRVARPLPWHAVPCRAMRASSGTWTAPGTCNLQGGRGPQVCSPP